MPLRYVLDEHLRGPVFHAILRHNRLGAYPIEAVCVGDPPDLPLGTLDPELLKWAEREQRILVCDDRRTMATHLADHLGAGRHSPGVFILRQHTIIPELVTFLRDAAYSSESAEWENQIRYIP